jgi:hypothetical protein
VLETFTQLDERVGPAMVPRVPGLALRRAHAVDHPVDHVLEPRAVEIRELTADREHPPVGLPPHPQAPRRTPCPRLVHRGRALCAHHRRQIDRRHLRSPPRPLRVAGLVGQLRDRPQLLPTQHTRIRRRRDLRQRLQRPRGLHRLASLPAPPPANGAAHPPTRRAARPTMRSPGVAADRDARSRRTCTHPTTRV